MSQALASAETDRNVSKKELGDMIQTLYKNAQDASGNVNRDLLREELNRVGLNHTQLGAEIMRFHSKPNPESVMMYMGGLDDAKFKKHIKDLETKMTTQASRI